jgi:hypothetical protein
MHLRLLAASAAILLTAAAGAQTPLATQITAQLGANDLKGDVSFLASDALEGRGTPSRGLDIAGEFIAAQFRRAGLEPIGDDGYFQTAQYANVTANTDGLQLTLKIGEKTVTVEKSSMMLADAAAVDLSAAAVYVATSAGLAELKPEDVRGKVLILDAVAGRPSRARAAQLARLAPVLVITQAAGPGATGGRGGARLREAGASVLPSLTVWDKAFRDALADTKPGPAEATIAAKIPAPKVEQVKLRNVVGLLRGSDAALRDTYLLVTGHYDHLGIRGTEGDRIFNGANDDASGTSCVIEIARTLAALPERPKRSIVFIALFGEEAGLLGSRYYAQHPIYPLAKTVADLNLEHLGRTDVEGGARVGILNATGFDYTDLPATLAQAGDFFGIKVVKDETNSDPFFARSDNQAFADAGIPAHTFSVGYVFPEYHQAGDEWQKIDYENMAKVARTIALGVYRVADNPAAPKWNAENPKTASYVKAR